MKNSISSRLDRISLHDSFVESVKRTDKRLTIGFAWSCLADYKEIGIRAPIVTSQSALTFYPFIKEDFSQAMEGDSLIEIAKPDDFEKYFELIGTTGFRTEGENTIFSIGGFYEDGKTTLFIQWDIYFESGYYEWDSYILLSQ